MRIVRGGQNAQKRSRYDYKISFHRGKSLSEQIDKFDDNLYEIKPIQLQSDIGLGLFLRWLVINT